MQDLITDKYHPLVADVASYVEDLGLRFDGFYSGYGKYMATDDRNVYTTGTTIMFKNKDELEEKIIENCYKFGNPDNIRHLLAFYKKTLFKN